MKIAILTQPLGHNYGGILQNFALKKTLEGFGYEAITINRVYQQRNSLKQLLSAIKNQTLNRFTGVYYYKLTNKQKNYIYKENARFLDDYINLSKAIDNTKNLKKFFLQRKFDAVIVGSDQTWRPKYSPCITNYFLDFLYKNNNIKKIAYAASFGTDSWEFSTKETKVCKRLIEKFERVSVREIGGVELCEKYLSNKAQFVLDPTLLLTAKDYIELIDKKLSNDKYEAEGKIFNYVLDDSQNKIDFIEEVAREMDKVSFRTQPKRKIIDMDSNNLTDYSYPPIEEWLNSFYRSDFIITDSFHGTVMSIVFQKPFITIINKDRGAARFYSLLKALDLESRLVNDLSSFNKEMIFEKINYEHVNEKVQLMKESSLDFLREALDYQKIY